MSEILTSQGPWMEDEVFNSIMHSSSKQQGARFVQVVQRSPLQLSDTSCIMSCRLSEEENELPDWVETGTIVQLKEYQIRGCSSPNLELFLWSATPLELVGGIGSGVVGDAIDIQQTIPVRRVLQSCETTEILQRLNHNGGSPSNKSPSNKPSLAQILLDGEEADDEGYSDDEEVENLRPETQEFRTTPNLGVESLLQDKSKLLEVLDDDDNEAEEEGVEALLKDKEKLLQILNDSDAESNKEDNSVPLNDTEEHVVNPSKLLREDIMRSSDDDEEYDGNNKKPKKLRRSPQRRKRPLVQEEEESLVVSRNDFDQDGLDNEASNTVVEKQNSIFRTPDTEDSNKRRRTLPEDNDVLSKDEDHSLSETDGRELERSLSRISEEESQSSSEPVVGISDVLITDAIQADSGRNVIINRLPSDDNINKPVDTQNLAKVLGQQQLANDNEAGLESGLKIVSMKMQSQNSPFVAQRPNSLSALTPRQVSAGTAAAGNNSSPSDRPVPTTDKDFRKRFEKVQKFYLQLWEQRNANTFKIIH